MVSKATLMSGFRLKNEIDATVLNLITYTMVGFVSDIEKTKVYCSNRRTMLENKI